jgi:hypothetical protein
VQRQCKGLSYITHKYIYYAKFMYWWLQLIWYCITSSYYRTMAALHCVTLDVL